MRIPILMASVAALGFGVAAAASRSFIEPTLQERPVIERRLTCPDGYALYELQKKEEYSSFTHCANCVTFTTASGSGTFAITDEKGQTWQQGSVPKTSEHVCVSKPPKKSKDDGEKE